MLSSSNTIAERKSVFRLNDYHQFASATGHGPIAFTSLSTRTNILCELLL